MKAFMVVQYDYDDTTIDSFWLNKDSAEKRRSEASKKSEQEHIEMEESSKKRLEHYIKEGKCEYIEYLESIYEDKWVVQDIEIKEV